MHQLDLAPVKSLLEQAKPIAILTHQRPDGDAIGSSLGLYHILKNLGHQPRVITPTDYPANLKWLSDNNKVIIAPNDMEAALKAVSAARLIFCLDMNALSRIEPMDAALRFAQVPVVMMDHHLDPEGFHTYAYWDDQAASTAEMVYRFVRDAGLLESVDSAAAQALYMGILTDTGSFRFPAVTADTHRIAADLMDRGAEPAEAYELIYNNDPAKRLGLLGYVLNERMTLIPEKHFAYMTIPLSDMEKFDIQNGDTEGFVNFPLSVRGINLSVIMKQDQEKIRMSFRSRGSFPANELAAHFSGGGHHNAAGGRSAESLDATVEKLLELVDRYAAQLDYDVLG
ncbi:MAG: bifunctional oligoribonuclease/PAP phosphatase NrnA [Bacteroidia bacterium]